MGVLQCKLNHCAGLIKYRLLLNVTQQNSNMVYSVLCDAAAVLFFPLRFFCSDLRDSGTLSQKKLAKTGLS